MTAEKATWQERVLWWAEELKKSSPSLASLILCADFLEEDEQHVTLVVGTPFHQQILSSVAAMTQLMGAAVRAGLTSKRLEFVTAAQCEQSLPPKEAIVQEVWENFL